MAPSIPTTPSEEAKGVKMYVSRDFYGTMDSQLSVFFEDVVEVISDNDKYWWLVREVSSGQSGYIPSDILETMDEHEARMNRQRNVELTRIRETDLVDENALPWRGNYPLTTLNQQDNEYGDTVPWSGSGFMRRVKGESRHKKTVSFSETKPVTHHFEVEDSGASSSSGSETDLLSRNLQSLEVEEDPVVLIHNRVDPLVEEILRKEFGSPIEDKLTLADKRFILREETFSRPLEVEKEFFMEEKKKTSHLKRNTPRRLKDIVAKIWRSRKGRKEVVQNKQMIKIHAGNIFDADSYKTMEVEEEMTLGMLAEKACFKFGVAGDGFDYTLSIVHHETHELLQASPNYSIGLVIEMAKRATLMERESAIMMKPTKVKNTSRISSPIYNPFNKNIDNNPVNQQFVAIQEFNRDRKSDFCTNYKFVLNRWLEGPSTCLPFYLRIQVCMMNSQMRNTSSVKRTSLFSMSSQPLDNKTAEEDVKHGKILVNTSMSMAEMMRAAFVSLEIGKHSSSMQQYEMYLSVGQIMNISDRVYLTKEMALHDVLQLKPMVDPSALVIILHPLIAENNMKAVIASPRIGGSITNNIR